MSTELPPVEDETTHKKHRSVWWLVYKIAVVIVLLFEVLSYVSETVAEANLALGTLAENVLTQLEQVSPIALFEQFLMAEKHYVARRGNCASDDVAFCSGAVPYKNMTLGDAPSEDSASSAQTKIMRVSQVWSPPGQTSDGAKDNSLFLHSYPQITASDVAADNAAGAAAIPASDSAPAASSDTQISPPSDKKIDLFREWPAPSTYRASPGIGSEAAADNAAGPAASDAAPASDSAPVASSDTYISPPSDKKIDLFRQWPSRPTYRGSPEIASDAAVGSAAVTGTVGSDANADYAQALRLADLERQDQDWDFGSLVWYVGPIPFPAFHTITGVPYAIMKVSLYASKVGVIGATIYWVSALIGATLAVPIMWSIIASSGKSKISRWSFAVCLAYSVIAGSHGHNSGHGWIFISLVMVPLGLFIIWTTLCSFIISVAFMVPIFLAFLVSKTVGLFVFVGSIPPWLHQIVEFITKFLAGKEIHEICKELFDPLFKQLRKLQHP